MKTVLITGASGFIGKYLIDKFVGIYKVIGIDKDRLENISYDYFYQIDITDTKGIENVFKQHTIHYVIHTAAEKSLVKCEAEQERAYHTNYLATIHIYGQSKKVGAKFIFISSDQVFDGKEGDYTEECETNAINYYGELKALAEEKLIEDKEVALCRTALTFGEIPEHQIPYFERIKHEEMLVVQGYIVQHVIHKLQHKQPIILPKDEFITPTSVELLYEQIRAVIEHNATGIIHCCGGEKISRYAFGKKIAKVFELDDQWVIHKISQDVLRPKDVSLNTKLSSSILGMTFWDLETMLVKIRNSIEVKGGTENAGDK